LPDCLTSIFGQQGTHDFEVIAIDDASTDNTQEVLRSFADSRMQVVRHSKNLGHVATVNEGLGQAGGEFIARIDPDDRYRSHFLSAVLEKFREFPEVGLVYGDAALIDDRGQISEEQSDRAHGGKDFKGNEFLRLLEDNFICAPTTMGRREAWQKALPIPAGLAFNDWYFNLMMARNHDFYYMHRVIADYRVHAANHHTKIVQDKSEEPSIFRLLDDIYGEPETKSGLEESKRQAKGRVYGAQYVTLANKYFGMGLNADARRCYVRAIRNRPAYLLRTEVQRRLAATLIGRHRYEFGKALIKSTQVRG
jgi:glycosyltransferase involved in cell wall biosynthesis